MGGTKIKKIDDSVEESRQRSSIREESYKKLDKEKLEPETRAEAEAETKQSQDSGVGKSPTPRSPKPVGQNDKVEKTVAKKLTKKSGKKVKSRLRSKKYQEAVAKVDKAIVYPLSQALELAKETSYSKFEGSLEIHINTVLKNIRGLITLPHLSGKKLTILAFGNGAKGAGADIEGDDSKLAEIEKGRIDFDVLVVTPVWMPKLARSAKILGPRGLMPNPKNGTVTDNLEKTITEIKSGKVEYKTEPNQNVLHLLIGKLNQPSEELSANIKILFISIGKSKIRKIVLSPTMGPGIKVDLSTL